MSDDLATLELPELRRRRAGAQEEEARLSYVRRLAQGRVDIVSAEVGCRHRGEPGVLVTELPEILGHEQRTATNRGSLGATPDVGDPEVTAALDEIAPPSRLLDLPSLPDDELHELLDRLAAYERDVSARRHVLHDEIDRLQEEIVRRYKTGEATIDSLLS